MTEPNHAILSFILTITAAEEAATTSAFRGASRMIEVQAHRSFIVMASSSHSLGAEG